MRPLMNIAFVVAVLLLLPACSTQPGGSEDPEGFKTTLTPPGPADQAAPVSASGADTAALADLHSRLDAAEQRIDRLEQSFSDLQQSIAAIQQTASQAMEKAEKGPLAGVDIENDDQVGKALMKQSLEQIMGISRLLLDKMESKVQEMEQSAPSETPSEPEAGTAVETQAQ